MEMISGIFSGLAAAFGISLSYLFSRLFYRNTRKGAVHLLACSNIQMGMFAFFILPFIWQGATMFSVILLLPAAGAALFITMGQITFFLALKQVNPSQVTPLLALKIIVLAFASIVFLHKPLSSLQWLSVFLCVGATFVLHFSGEPIPLRGFLGILMTCIGYALSDVCITILLQKLAWLGLRNTVFLGTCLTYMVAGLLGLLLLIFTWRDLTAWPVWKFSGYFVLTFFIAELFLFNAFRLVGPVFGNVLQSTRAMISILLAKLVAMQGIKELEQDMSTAVILRRLLAAGLFSCAIALYILG